MPDQRLAFARELARQDETLAASIAEVAELQDSVEAIARRVEEISDVLARLPEERDAAGAAFKRAEGDLEDRAQHLSRLDEELAAAERSGKPERVEAARRAHERARDAVQLAETRFGRAAAELGRLDGQEAAARTAIAELDAAARSVTEHVRAVRRLSATGAEAPEGGLDGTAAWASRARGALLVVRSGLETEREIVVREANELGASVFGEPVTASVAGVVDRLERA